MYNSMTRPAWQESIANLNFVFDRLRLCIHMYRIAALAIKIGMEATAGASIFQRQGRILMQPRAAPWERRTKKSQSSERAFQTIPQSLEPAKI
jgi:hypothetical protein